MLSQKDLKAIEGLLDRKLEQKLEEKLESKLEEKFVKFSRLELTPIKKDLSSIKKDLRQVVNYFDNENLGLRRRVDRIDVILGTKNPS